MFGGTFFACKQIRGTLKGVGGAIVFPFLFVFNQRFPFVGRHFLMSHESKILGLDFLVAYIQKNGGSQIEIDASQSIQVQLTEMRIVPGFHHFFLGGFLDGIIVNTTF